MQVGQVVRGAADVIVRLGQPIHTASGGRPTTRSSSRSPRARRRLEPRPPDFTREHGGPRRWIHTPATRGTPPAALRRVHRGATPPHRRSAAHRRTVHPRVRPVAQVRHPRPAARPRHPPDPQEAVQAGAKQLRQQFRLERASTAACRLRRHGRRAYIRSAYFAAEPRDARQRRLRVRRDVRRDARRRPTSAIDPWTAVLPRAPLPRRRLPDLRRDGLRRAGRAAGAVHAAHDRLRRPARQPRRRRSASAPRRRSSRCRCSKSKGLPLPAFFGRLVWAFGALYLSCAAIRLARFNVSNEHGEQHHFSFLGLPSPGAGGAVVGVDPDAAGPAAMEQGLAATDPSPAAVVERSARLPLAAARDRADHRAADGQHHPLPAHGQPLPARPPVARPPGAGAGDPAGAWSSPTATPSGSGARVRAVRALHASRRSRPARAGRRTARRPPTGPASPAPRHARGPLRHRSTRRCPRPDGPRRHGRRHAVSRPMSTAAAPARIPRRSPTPPGSSPASRLADRLPPRRRGAHGAVQLAARPPRRRAVPAPHRRHRPRPQHRAGDAAAPGRPPLARPALGQPAARLPVEAAGRLQPHHRRPDRARTWRTRRTKRTKSSTRLRKQAESRKQSVHLPPAAAHGEQVAPLRGRRPPARRALRDAGEGVPLPRRRARQGDRRRGRTRCRTSSSARRTGCRRTTSRSSSTTRRWASRTSSAGRSTRSTRSTTSRCRKRSATRARPTATCRSS